VSRKLRFLMESRCVREPFPFSSARIIHPPEGFSPAEFVVRKRNRLLSFPRRACACACSFVSSLVGFSVPDKLGEDHTYYLASFYCVSSSPPRRFLPLELPTVQQIRAIPSFLFVFGHLPPPSGAKSRYSCLFDCFHFITFSFVPFSFVLIAAVEFRCNEKSIG